MLEYEKTPSTPKCFLKTNDPAMWQSREVTGRLTRRGLLLGGSLSAGTFLCNPSPTCAQPGITEIDLPYGEQRRAADSLAEAGRSYAHFHINALYIGKYKAPQAADKQLLEESSSYLINTLQRRLDDAEWITQLTEQHSDAFEAALAAAIRRSTMPSELKESLTAALRSPPFHERNAEVTRRAGSRFDGMVVRLKDAAKDGGVAHPPRLELSLAAFQ